MKCARGALALLLTGGLLLPAFVHFSRATTPYDSITERNSFALLPPTPATPPEPPTPPANIKLTGISTWGGEKRAMLMVQDTSGPGKPDQSVILREGQRDNQVECIEINDTAGYVKVKNLDVVSTLTFDKDGVKGAAAAPPTAPGAPVQPPILNPPRPGVPNPTMTSIEQPRPRGGLRQIPTRTLRSAQGMRDANNPPPGPSSMAAPAQGLSSPPVTSSSANLTPEEEALLKRANDMLNKSKEAEETGQPTPQ